MFTIDKLPLATRGRLVEALTASSDTEWRRLGRRPRRQEVIMRTMTEALHVLGRLPDQEMKWIKAGQQSTWRLRFALSDDERLDAYRQMQWLVVKGLESEEFLLSRSPVSPKEMNTMQDVFEVFRAAMRGKDVGRDWQILTLVAAGLSNHAAGKKLTPRLTAGSVKSRAELQSTRIGYVLRDLIPSTVQIIDTRPRIGDMSYVTQASQSASE
jgi:ATP/maltotriose-dependent transcriptional regulator MalT